MDVFDNPGFFVSYALIQTAALVLLLRVLDPYEREPLSAMGLAALWGATGAAAIALLGNEAVQGLLSPRTQDVFGAAISAPIVEETAKGLALVAIAAASRWASPRLGTPLFEGVTEGVVYGAAVGFGFAFTEDFFFFLNQAREGGLDSGIKLFVARRDFFGPTSLHHPLFTATFGAALGLAAWSRTRRWRVGLPVLGLGTAILAHAVNNGLAEVVLTVRYGLDATAAWVRGDTVSDAVASTGASVEQVLRILDYAYIVVAMAAVLLWQRHQRRVISAELREEVAHGLVREADRRTVSGVWRRTRSYLYLLGHGEIAGWLTLRRFHQAVIELALVKWRVNRFGGDLDRIRRCRRELAALEASGGPRGNIRLPRTALFGREREVVKVWGLLSRHDVRLITLTGPPGVGRTRIAREVADGFAEIFAGGAHLVALTDETDAAGLIAHTLGIKELPGQPPVSRMAEYLRDAQVLLVLDDVDTSPGASALLAELLEAAPCLKILATSRRPLAVPGEREHPVPPLPVAALGKVHHLSALDASPALALFVARAQAVEPAFALDDENVATVAEVCRRLQGLPLAIELAASMVRRMPVDAILGELAARLDQQGDGPNAVLDWTLAHLGAEERALFDRLTVFVGGFTLRAAKTVCADAGGVVVADLAETLCSLVGRDLLWQEKDPENEPRFEIPPVIRQFVRERLGDRLVETDGVNRAHRDWCLSLAEDVEADRESWGGGRGPLRLRPEHQNLLAALAWSEARQETVPTVRLAAALQHYWEDGLVTEGSRLLEHALEQDQRIPAAVRTKGSYCAGVLALLHPNFDRAGHLLTEALISARELGEPAATLRAVMALGWTHLLRGDYLAAAAGFDEAVAIARSLGDEALLAQALNAQGRALGEQGEVARARSLLERGLTLRRLLGDEAAVAGSLAHLGRLALQEGLHDEAVLCLDESIAISREIGECFAAAPTHHRIIRALDRGAEKIAMSLHLGARVRTVEALHTRALVALDRGDLTKAGALGKERLVICYHVGDRLGIAESIEVVAAAAAEEVEEAVRLFGFTAAKRNDLAAPRWRVDEARHERALERARVALPANMVFDTVWQAGQDMGPEAAFRLALDV